MCIRFVFVFFNNIILYCAWTLPFKERDATLVIWKKSKTLNCSMVTNRNRTWSWTPSGAHSVTTASWTLSVRNTTWKSMWHLWTRENRSTRVENPFPLHHTHTHTTIIIDSHPARKMWIFFFLYRYEKMISGMYMGELVRLIIMDLVKEKNLFDGQMPKKIGIASAFESAYISTIEG